MRRRVALVTVVVVTDAAARLPADLLDKWAIRVVPLHILLDGGDLRDGVDEIPDDLYKRHATTAAATPAELANAYQQALTDSGGDGVVAVHISSALSGTFGVAQRTAADLGPAIRVVDSKSAAMGTGFVALAAARAAAAGDDLDMDAFGLQRLDHAADVQLDVDHDQIGALAGAERRHRFVDVVDLSDLGTARERDLAGGADVTRKRSDDEKTHISNS